MIGFFGMWNLLVKVLIFVLSAAMVGTSFSFKYVLKFFNLLFFVFFLILIVIWMFWLIRLVM